jgi:4-alpha-glucanotransferase
VDFHRFLQWQASLARERLQREARNAGMAMGVIADLAVGADPGGSQAWGLQPAMLKGLSVGAPPDLLAHQGQDWGLGALSPRALREQGFAPWLAMLRANMAHSGGIRIDHVLGCAACGWCPKARPRPPGPTCISRCRICCG